MSDDLEKFTLEYRVEVKDSETKLKSLEKRVEDVGGKHKKSLKELKGHTSELSEEFGKVAPQIDGITSALSKMGAQAGLAGGAAALAFGGIAIAVKSTMQAMKLLNEQRLQGFDAGMSGLGLNDLTQKYMTRGNGNVTREMVANDAKRQQDWLIDLQSDPYGMKAAKARLAMPWLQIHNADGSNITNSQLYAQEAKAWKNTSDADVVMQARAMGMSPDMALSTKRIGDSMTDPSQTLAQMETYTKAAEGAQQFHKAMADLSNDFSQLSTGLGEHLLPYLGALSKWVDDHTRGWTGTVGHALGWDRTDAQKKHEDDLKKQVEAEARAGKLKTVDMSAQDADMQVNIEVEKRLAAERAKKTADDAAAKKAGTATSEDKGKSDAKAYLSKADQQNQQTADDYAKFKESVELFSASVADMKGALTQGEILQNLFKGTGGGFGNPGAPMVQSGIPQNDRYSAKSKYHELYAAAEAANGLPQGLLERIGHIENGPQDPTLTNKKTGASGLMQIMPANFESLGIKDWTDPAQNIAGGGKLLGGYIKKYGLRDGIAAYNAGTNRQKWNLASVQGYVNDAVGPQGSAQPAASPALSANDAIYSRRRYAEAIAKAEGMPTSQVVNQGRSTGDADREASMLNLKATNAHTQAVMRYQALLAAQSSGGLVANGAIARAAMEANSTSVDLLDLQRGQEARAFTYLGAPTAMTSNVPQFGGGSGVSNTFNNTFNISEAHDAHKVAEVANDHLKRQFKDAVNQVTTTVVR